MNPGILVISVIQLSMNEVFEDLFQSIIDAMKSIIKSFTSMITAVPDAVATIFSQWAWIVGNTWYGPILGALTIAAVFLIGYGMLWFVERFLF